MNNEQLLEHLLENATPTIKISGMSDEEWYRKPSGSRRGPWLSADYEILDATRWKKNKPCIYFLVDDNKRLRYVGISVNTINDRWRLSPAYDSDLKSLDRQELFHSQCWSHMCNQKRETGKGMFFVLSMYDDELVSTLSEVKHEASGLSCFKRDPDIAVVAMEVWIIKSFFDSLWNKRK